MTAEPMLVALDFTADTLRLLLAEPDGSLALTERWPLPELPDEETWAWEVGGRIATLFAREGHGRSALGIAIAAPGKVEPVSGRLVRNAGQPGWEGLAVADALRRHIDAPVACESRTIAALLGEAWQGAAAGVRDVLYVSLRDVPSAAVLVGGRPLRGAHSTAGALPVMPDLHPGTDDELETAAGVLADAVALLDPELVVIDAEPEQVRRLAPLLRQAIDAIAPGPEVVTGKLGEEAAVLGAVRIAVSVAFEGRRRP